MRYRIAIKGGLLFVNRRQFNLMSQDADAHVFYNKAFAQTTSNRLNKTFPHLETEVEELEQDRYDSGYVIVADTHAGKLRVYCGIGGFLDAEDFIEAMIFEYANHANVHVDMIRRVPVFHYVKNIRVMNILDEEFIRWIK